MNRKYLISGIFILLFIVLLVIVQTGILGRNRSTFSRPTSFDTGVSGHKAFFLLLQKMGYTTERYTKLLDNIQESSFKNFLIINPYSMEVKPEDSGKLIEYAKKGNKVLIAVDENNKILENLNVKIIYPQKTTESVFKGEMAENLKTLEIGIKSRLQTDSRYYNTLLEDQYGIIAASIKYDNGEIILFSLPDIFSNSRINKGDNLILISKILKYLGNDAIGVDESLHGIINYKANMEFSPLAWALIAQAILIVVIFYISAMRRFGRPRRVSAEVLRTSTEYVHSLSNLFLKAAASGFVVDNCLRGLKRRIAGPCRITPETPDKKMLENIRYSNLIDEGIMTSYLEKINRAKHGKSLSETDLLKIYGEADKISSSIIS